MIIYLVNQLYSFFFVNYEIYLLRYYLRKFIFFLFVCGSFYSSILIHVMLSTLFKFFTCKGYRNKV